MRDRILDLLKCADLTGEELVHALKATRTEVYQELVRLSDSGRARFIKRRGGLSMWTLLS